MKCVKKSEIAVRVSEEKAEELVNKHGYAYCSKLIWKETGRHYWKEYRKVVENV